MSDFIRVYGMKMSHIGTCAKCAKSREKGNHSQCDRWPGINSMRFGFHYVANSKETTLAELKRVVEAICAGDSDQTPVQFEIRIRQRLNP
jgi:hypothetical protein